MEDSSANMDILSKSSDSMQIETSSEELALKSIVQRLCKKMEIEYSGEDLRLPINLIISKLQILPPNFLGEPLFLRQSFNSDQMEMLKEINSALENDYQQRKELLMKRFAVTLNVFLTSPKGEENKEAMKKFVEEKYASLSSKTNIDLADAFLARGDILKIRKTSYKSNNSKSELKSLISLGNVPDRGGRIDKSSTGSMPAFKPREEASATHSKPNQKSEKRNNNNNNNQNFQKGEKKARRS